MDVYKNEFTHLLTLVSMHFTPITNASMHPRTYTRPNKRQQTQAQAQLQLQTQTNTHTHTDTNTNTNTHTHTHTATQRTRLQQQRTTARSAILRGHVQRCLQLLFITLFWA
jgi:ABC-type nickel/cobalt efflux system permease component RcnA